MSESALTTSKRDKERVTTRSEHMQNLGHLKRNAVWYEANLDALLPKYQGRYVAIADGKVYGDYEDFNVGVDAMICAGHKPGTFMVHLCVLREEETPWVCLSGRADFSRSMS